LPAVFSDNLGLRPGLAAIVASRDFPMFPEK
jgi:hypothetical protein